MRSRVYTKDGAGFWREPGRTESLTPSGLVDVACKAPSGTKITVDLPANPKQTWTREEIINIQNHMVAIGEDRSAVGAMEFLLGMTEEA